MKAFVLYRIASVFLVLFAAVHTLGFQTTKPEWGVGPLIKSMREIHFLVQGFSRTYRNFYIGFGLFVAALLLFAALVSWQLGILSSETLLLMRVSSRALAAFFGVVTILSWNYLFIVPILFSIATIACSVLAAWFSKKRSQS